MFVYLFFFLCCCFRKLFKATFAELLSSRERHRMRMTAATAATNFALAVGTMCRRQRASLRLGDSTGDCRPPVVLDTRRGNAKRQRPRAAAKRKNGEGKRKPSRSAPKINLRPRRRYVSLRTRNSRVSLSLSFLFPPPCGFRRTFAARIQLREERCTFNA